MTSANLAQASPIKDYAIIVDPTDNVAVVKKPTEPGLEVALVDDRIIRVNAMVPPGHRFATSASRPRPAVRTGILA